MPYEQPLTTRPELPTSYSRRLKPGPNFNHARDTTKFPHLYFAFDRWPGAVAGLSVRADAPAESGGRDPCRRSAGLGRHRPYHHRAGVRRNSEAEHGSAELYLLTRTPATHVPFGSRDAAALHAFGAQRGRLAGGRGNRPAIRAGIGAGTMDRYTGDRRTEREPRIADHHHGDCRSGD